MSSGEYKLADAPLVAAAGGTEGVPNPAFVCPTVLLLPAATGALAPKTLPNPPPPPPVFAVEEKLKPEAEPNPEAAVGALETGAAKEKEEAERAEGAAEEESNPKRGCVGPTEALPKAAEDDGAAEEPNALLPTAKLKVLAWTGAWVPNPSGSERFRMKTGAMSLTT